MLPAYLLAIVLHEAGHALTTKAFGREIPRVGLGWYWCTPVAFVDTSDMWLEERWPRIVVNLAGVYTNMVLAGSAALGVWLTSSPGLTAALWQFALVSYMIVLVNLNPLLEYDGYYVLMDLLDRPNLRRHALAWVRHELVTALRTPGGMRGHWVELVYGLGSLLYVALMAVLTVVLYRLLVEAWMARLLPHALAAGLAWLFAATVVAMTVVSVLGELSAIRRPAAVR